MCQDKRVSLQEHLIKLRKAQVIKRVNGWIRTGEAAALQVPGGFLAGVKHPDFLPDEFVARDDEHVFGTLEEALAGGEMIRKHAVLGDDDLYV